MTQPSESLGTPEWEELGIEEQVFAEPMNAGHGEADPLLPREDDNDGDQ